MQKPRLYKSCAIVRRFHKSLVGSTFDLFLSLLVPFNSELLISQLLERRIDSAEPLVARNFFFEIYVRPVGRPSLGLLLRLATLTILSRTLPSRWPRSATVTAVAASSPVRVITSRWRRRTDNGKKLPMLCRSPPTATDRNRAPPHPRTALGASSGKCE